MALTQRTYYFDGPMTDAALQREVGATTTIISKSTCHVIVEVDDEEKQGVVESLDETMKRSGFVPVMGSGFTLLAPNGTIHPLEIDNDGAVAVGERLYKESEFKGNKLIRQSFYATKNPDETLADKTEEWTFVYKKNKLLSETQERFTDSGSVTTTWSYSTTKIGKNKVISRIKNE